MNKATLERYNRNILIPQVGEAGQERLLNAKVLVAGAGGLGSTVITSLSAVGVGTLGIVDQDTIELSNLNRQYIHMPKSLGKAKVTSAKSWVNTFNPDIEVVPYQTRLTLENYEDIIPGYDLVVDCFDSFDSKFTLNKACVQSSKTLIHGGVTEFYGQVITIIPGKSSCTSCIFPEKQSNDYVTKGVISPAVSFIASVQAMEVIKVLLNIDSLLVDTLLCYDGLAQSVKKISLKKNPNCPDCQFIHHKP